MEIKRGDYVKYKGKVYSVDFSYFDNTYDLISYKDLEILEDVHESELERLTDFHVSVMRYNKTLPKRRFKVGDRVKIRADLDSESVYGSTFNDMGFTIDGSYLVRYSPDCLLNVEHYNIHEFEVELVEGN